MSFHWYEHHFSSDPARVQYAKENISLESETPAQSLATCLCFDSLHELVYVGWQDGVISSYVPLLPSNISNMYSTFKAHNHPIIAMHSFSTSSFTSMDKLLSHLVSMSKNLIAIATPGGQILLRFPIKMINLNPLDNSFVNFIPMKHRGVKGKFLVSISPGRLVELDVSGGLEKPPKTNGLLLNESEEFVLVKMMRETSRGSVVCAHDNGSFSLYDQRADAFMYGPIPTGFDTISDIDTMDNTIVICCRNKNEDKNVVKLFDMRSLMTGSNSTKNNYNALTVVVSSGTCFGRFLPSQKPKSNAFFSGKQGNITIVGGLDSSSATSTNNPSANNGSLCGQVLEQNKMNLHESDERVVAMELCQNELCDNDIIAFITNYGSLHMWTNSNAPAGNPGKRVLINPKNHNQIDLMKFRDKLEQQYNDIVEQSNGKNTSPENIFNGNPGLGYVEFYKDFMKLKNDDSFFKDAEQKFFEHGETLVEPIENFIIKPGVKPPTDETDLQQLKKVVFFEFDRRDKDWGEEVEIEPIVPAKISPAFTNDVRFPIVASKSLVSATLMLLYFSTTFINSLKAMEEEEVLEANADHEFYRYLISILNLCSSRLKEISMKGFEDIIDYDNFAPAQYSGFRKQLNTYLLEMKRDLSDSINKLLTNQKQFENHLDFLESAIEICCDFDPENAVKMIHLQLDLQDQVEQKIYLDQLSDSLSQNLKFTSARCESEDLDQIIVSFGESETALKFNEIPERLSITAMHKKPGLYAVTSVDSPHENQNQLVLTQIICSPVTDDGSNVVMFIRIATKMEGSLQDEEDSSDLRKAERLQWIKISAESAEVISDLSFGLKDIADNFRILFLVYNTFSQSNQFDHRIEEKFVDEMLLEKEFPNWSKMKSTSRVIAMDVEAYDDPVLLSFKANGQSNFDRCAPKKVFLSKIHAALISKTGLQQISEDFNVVPENESSSEEIWLRHLRLAKKISMLIASDFLFVGFGIKYILKECGVFVPPENILDFNEVFQYTDAGQLIIDRTRSEVFCEFVSALMNVSVFHCDSYQMLRLLYKVHAIFQRLCEQKQLQAKIQQMTSR